MREVGEVVSVNESGAEIKIDKKDECSKCGMCLFPKGANSITVKALNEVGAKVGDRVVIENRESMKTIGIVLVFLVPLLLIGLSVFIGYVVIKKEIWILFISIILILFWYIILSLIDNKLKRLKQFIPVIVGIDQVKEEEKDERNNGDNV